MQTSRHQSSLITLATWRGGMLCYGVTTQKTPRPRKGH